MTDRVQMQPAPGADPWSFFDRIFCITLKERPDRRVQAEAQFARVGLTGRVIFYVADRHPTDCEQGIYESHLACLRRGLAEGARRLLIFEDDVLFEGFDPQRFAAALAFLDGQPDWQILFLGCLVKGSRATASPAVRAISYGCLTHAYAVNRPCAETLTQHPWRGLPIDAVMARLNQGFYGCYPMFAFQSNAASDNYRLRRLDRFRRWCGGLRRIQKFNEFWHRRRTPLVILHIVGLAVLLWLVFP
ncbi:MAG: glycosyltransferase [Desulfobacterales bacterium]|nr:glycosyltransferase [Desulfobacterales bacterium]